jgi:hypothetical protein
LYSANFKNLAATDPSGSDVTVEVDLITKQSSCHTQEWIGTYHVVNVGGDWLIHNHDFPNPPSC